MKLNKTCAVFLANATNGHCAGRGIVILQNGTRVNENCPHSPNAMAIDERRSDAKKKKEKGGIWGEEKLIYAYASFY